MQKRIQIIVGTVHGTFLKTEVIMGSKRFGAQISHFCATFGKKKGRK